MFQKAELKQQDSLDSHILGIKNDIELTKKEADNARRLLKMRQYPAPEIANPLRAEIRNCIIALCT